MSIICYTSTGSFGFLLPYCLALEFISCWLGTASGTLVCLLALLYGIFHPRLLVFSHISALNLYSFMLYSFILACLLSHITIFLYSFIFYLSKLHVAEALVLKVYSYIFVAVAELLLHIPFHSIHSSALLLHVAVAELGFSEF